jgi:hypothetical protein
MIKGLWLFVIKELLKSHTVLRFGKASLLSREQGMNLLLSIFWKS